MGNFNIKEYFEIKEKALSALSESKRADVEFMNLIKSKKDWQKFLTHYCEFTNPEFNMTYCELKPSTKPNYYYIEWDDVFRSDIEVYWTRELSEDTIMKFLDSEDFFEKIDKRLNSIKKTMRKKIEKENEEREFKLYQLLKEKYERKES